MSNDSETVQIEMQPEEAVALALCQDLIENNPAIVKAILVQHQVQPSTDPEANILALAKLSAERGRFFNEDFDKAVTAAGYYRTEMMPDVLSRYVARHRDIKTFRSGYFSIKDLFKKKPGGTQVGNLIKNLFGKKPTEVAGPPLAPGDVATSPEAKELMDKIEKTAGEGEDDDTDKDKILGLTPWIFWTGTGFVLVLIIVIIILIMRAGKKKAPAAAAAK
ncbi:MAG: hypothetical protein V4721_16590 [Bacteroidota bacterium]